MERSAGQRWSWRCWRPVATGGGWRQSPVILVPLSRPDGWRGFPCFDWKGVSPTLRYRRWYRERGDARAIPTEIDRLLPGLVRHRAIAPPYPIPVSDGKDVDRGNAVGTASWGDGEGDCPSYVLPGCPGGAAMPLIRTTAVMPTATAPTTAKTVCQTGEGMAIWAMPWVAL